MKIMDFTMSCKIDTMHGNYGINNKNKYLKV